MKKSLLAFVLLLLVVRTALALEPGDPGYNPWENDTDNGQHDPVNPNVNQVPEVDRSSGPSTTPEEIPDTKFDVTVPVEGSGGGEVNKQNEDGPDPIESGVGESTEDGNQQRYKNSQPDGLRGLDQSSTETLKSENDNRYYKGYYDGATDEMHLVEAKLFLYENFLKIEKRYLEKRKAGKTKDLKAEYDRLDGIYHKAFNTFGHISNFGKWAWGDYTKFGIKLESDFYDLKNNPERTYLKTFDPHEFFAVSKVSSVPGVGGTTLPSYLHADPKYEKNKPSTSSISSAPVSIINSSQYPVKTPVPPPSGGTTQTFGNYLRQKYGSTIGNQ